MIHPCCIDPYLLWLFQRPRRPKSALHIRFTLPARLSILSDHTILAHSEMASSLSAIDRPITMLRDYVATQPTTLRFKNHGKGGSTITDITNGSSPKEILKVDMKKAGTSASRRVYHDLTGSVLFELRRSWTSNDSFVGPPINDSRPYALIAPRGAPLKDKFDMYIQDTSSGGGEQNETKLEIRGQDIWKKNTFVYHGKDLVMQVRLVNLITCYVPFASNEWDVHVAQGMDTAAVSSFICECSMVISDI